VCHVYECVCLMTKDLSLCQKCIHCFLRWFIHILLLEVHVSMSKFWVEEEFVCQHGKDILVSYFLCAMNGAGFNTLFIFCMTRYMELGD